MDGLFFSSDGYCLTFTKELIIFTVMLKVISASRRLDMLAFYPDKLLHLLKSRCPPDRVHTLVLWSKWPENMLSFRRLKKYLLQYRQIFLHFTITGMGGTFLEPGIPPAEDALALLPDMVQFLGSAARCRWRFDPIVHLKMRGEAFTNLPRFSGIAETAVQYGIQDVTVSWMSPYDKVIKRLAEHNIEAPELTRQQKEADWLLLEDTARRLGLRLTGCCDPDLPSSRCIDGPLLTSLHPDGLKATTEKAGGQRPGCTCTKSWDIGWYYSCGGGCLYCYGQPARVPFKA